MITIIIMKGSADEPHPTDFLDCDTLEIDQVAFQSAYLAWEELDEDIPTTKKHKFRPRKTYRYKDPKTSQWYLDYVVDEYATFRDPKHRYENKLFICVLDIFLK